MSYYTVELELEDDSVDFVRAIENIRSVSVLSSIRSDKSITVSYSAGAIRHHLESTVKDDDEGMKLLSLVTDEQLEDIAIKEVIENDYYFDHIHQNMVDILRSATEGLKKQEKFKGEKDGLISDLLEIAEDRDEWRGVAWEEAARSDIQILFRGFLSPAPKQIASRAMLALRDLTVVTRESVESLLDWAAVDLDKGGK